jgi:hypothetical protein
MSEKGVFGVAMLVVGIFVTQATIVAQLSSTCGF